MEIKRWKVIEPEVDAVQVTAENAREVAAWCGGWPCDDLHWNEDMNCYMMPDDSEYPGAMFCSWDGQVPGGVMLSYGVPARVGAWIVFTQGRYRPFTDQEIWDSYVCLT